MKKKIICPVCGYPKLEEPPYDNQGLPTYVICHSCGTEFGYTDTNRTFKELREQWLRNKAKWKFPKYKPKDWKLEDQLKNLKK